MFWWSFLNLLIRERGRELEGWVGYLLRFNSNVTTAVFMCFGMVDEFWIYVITLMNSGDNMCQKFLYNSAGNPSGAGNFLFGILWSAVVISLRVSGASRKSAWALFSFGSFRLLKNLSISWTLHVSCLIYLIIKNVAWKFLYKSSEIYICSSKLLQLIRNISLYLIDLCIIT